MKKVENMKFEYKKHDFQKFLVENMNKSSWRIRTRDLRFTKQCFTYWAMKLYDQIDRNKLFHKLFKSPSCDVVL